MSAFLYIFFYRILLFKEIKMTMTTQQPLNERNHKTPGRWPNLYKILRTFHLVNSVTV